MRCAWVPYEIVGMAEDAVYGDAREPVPPVAYLAIEQEAESDREPVFLIHSRLPPAVLRSSVARAVDAVRPGPHGPAGARRRGRHARDHRNCRDDHPGAACGAPAANVRVAGGLTASPTNHDTNVHRVNNRVFVETPNSSTRDADVVDFCRCPRSDLGGISETPAEAEAEVRRLVVRAVAGRAARSAGEP